MRVSGQVQVSWPEKTGSAHALNFERSSWTRQDKG